MSRPNLDQAAAGVAGVKSGPDSGAGSKLAQNEQPTGIPDVVKFISRLERRAGSCRSPGRRATSIAIGSRNVSPVLVIQVAIPIYVWIDLELGLYGERRRIRSCHVCVCSILARVRDPSDRNFPGGGHAH